MMIHGAELSVIPRGALKSWSVCGTASRDPKPEQMRNRTVRVIFTYQGKRYEGRAWWVERAVANVHGEVIDRFAGTGILTGWSDGDRV